jgi:hypothetical protein
VPAAHQSANSLESARARAQRRASGERAGAHAEARAERRGNVAEEIAAAGAAAIIADGIGGVGAHPLTAGFALRVDTLNGEAGQILHRISFRGRRTLRAPRCACANLPLAGPDQVVGGNSAPRVLWCQAKTLPHIVVEFQGQRLPVDRRRRSQGTPPLFDPEPRP